MIGKSDCSKHKVSSLGRDRPRGMETGDGEFIEHVVPSVSGTCITHCGRRGLTHEMQS